MFLKKKSNGLKQECDELISECLKESTVHSSSTAPFVKLYKFEKAKLGINELQNRTNSKITWLSLLISLLSLIVAITALIVSINKN